MWQIHYHRQIHLPKLAWLAEVIPDEQCIHITHGTAVECFDQWCVEGVWEGRFEYGDFHKVENFFGSGVRIDGDDVYFSSSVAVIDRLLHTHLQGHLLVSNSLVQLLARTGARLDTAHDYIPETFASGQGIHHYPSAIRVIHPQLDTIYQEYHCNLIFQNGQLRRQVRSKARTFAHFDDYLECMQTALTHIHENYQSTLRHHRITAYATTSEGYDSPAAAALAKHLGVDQCFTTDINKALIDRHQETGVPVAQSLQLNIHKLASDPDKFSTLERYFLAACIDGSEIFFHDLARHLIEHQEIAVIYTGYYGDVIWDRGYGKPPYDDDIRRKDVSGLNISEIRLKAGFFNLALPCMYARNLGAIRAISQSPEMQPWSVSEDYDRPIPRRIAEQAGVARALFGNKKKAQLQYYDQPKNPELRQDFCDYLKQNLGLSAWHLQAHTALTTLDYRLGQMANKLPKNVTAQKLKQLNLRRTLMRRDINLRSLQFIWAANTLGADHASIYKSISL